VHSIGFAPREAISGDFLDGLTREELPHRARHLGLQLPGHGQGRPARLRPGAALLTLSYLGAVRYVPNYNTMGLAKASLEASVRYLAPSLGRKGIRVNGISAGPIKTLAARHQGLRQAAGHSPPPRRWAATSPSTTSATWPPSCCRTWPPASPPRSPTSTAASARPSSATTV
jgi:enoyl-[acyl-carrier-protein] reductase (NADH)